MTNISKPRRTRLDPALRRKQLLDIAFTMIAKHGLSRATQSQVAESAGLSIPAVYSYFKTREDMIHQALSQVETMLMDMVTTILVNKSPSHLELSRLARAFAETAHSNPDLAKVWLHWSTSVDTPFWASFLKFWKLQLRLTKQSLERAKRKGFAPYTLDTHAGSLLFVGAAQTITIMQFTNATKSEIDQFIEQVVRGALGVEPEMQSDLTNPK